MIPTLLALAAVQTVPAADVLTRSRDCLELVRAAPERAIEAASAWQAEGGGLEARQCLGLAHAALGNWTAAAEVFDEAAREAAAAPDPRAADLWVQSGNAWIAAGEANRAIRAIDAALAMRGLSDALRGEAHLDRARASVSLGNVADAREDLDRALALVPADPFAWYLSAALASREQDLPRARREIARAMELAPEHPDIVLLAGTLAGLAGDMAEAERLYRRVAESSPQTEAGRAAAASLATLREVEVDAPAAVPPAAAPPQPPQSR